VANLQIKGIDNELYNELKKIAAEEIRSVSQQTVFLVKDYIAIRQKIRGAKNRGQVLLDSPGSRKMTENQRRSFPKLERRGKM